MRLDAEAKRHVEATVSAFVVARYRARLQAKPVEFVERLCHDLEFLIDHRRAIRIANRVADSQILEVLQRLTPARSGYCLGNFGTCRPGVHVLEDALFMADWDGGAMISIEPGGLAYCVPEKPSHDDRLLLVRDPKRLQRAAKLLEPANRGPHGAS